MPKPTFSHRQWQTKIILFSPVLAAFVLMALAIAAMIYHAKPV